MANVRYMGGSSATLGTKEIDENGIYNASSDGLDGYSSVTVDVPAPSGSVNLEYTGNGQYSEDVSQYASAEITVDVPIPTVNTQTKSITASTSQQTVTPDPGYLLEQVTVNPQQNTDTYTPAANTPNNDMGTVNNYRYVNTSGMVSPTGVKSISIESNGTYTEDITNNKYVDIDVNVPVSGDLGTKTIITNGLYKALDDNLDGYSEVNVNVPQNATLGIKTITNNGNYNAITDGYDGYSRVDVNVSGATLQTSKSVTATTSQQTVTPDVGYDGMEQVIVNPQEHTQTYTPADNTAANDMGVNNNYRYVDTSGMYTPTSITPSNSLPSVLVSGSAVMPTANGLAISSLDNVTPSSTPTSVSSGDIVKIGGNGVIVDSIPTPTSITPSNISPVALTANQAVKPTSAGYAIGSYNTVTPSDTNPPILDYPYVYKPTGPGFLYDTPQPKVNVGTVTLSTSSNTAVNLGFDPKYICMYSPSSYYSNIYDENISTTSYIRATSAGPLLKAFNSNYNGGLASLMTNGFICRTCTTSVGLTWYYIAIG